jgi:phage tail-like protein
MNTASDRPPRPDLFRHLPGIYQSGRDSPNPFTVLVDVLAENHRMLEADLALMPRMLDPRTAPSAFDHPQRGFLEMLARWVAIDPAMLSRGPPSMAGKPDPRGAVLRHLVENAAPLQAARGTVAGTRYLLEVLFDADVEILEWQWPAAFQLGAAATLGADTLLLGEPPLERCITLVWNAPRLRPVIEWARARPETCLVLDLTTGQRRVGGIIVLADMVDIEAADAAGLHTAFREELLRLRQVLRQELPAHILSYIGFRPPERPAMPGPSPFIVGIADFATLGHIQILPDGQGIPGPSPFVVGIAASATLGHIQIQRES